MTTADIDPRIARARTALLLEQPFFGSLALHLKPVATRTVTNTMATDGEHLFYNTLFLDRTTEEQHKGTVLHEVLHVTNLHHTRRGPREAELWNEACDYAINPIVLQAGFRLPAGVLFDRALARAAEDVYSILMRQRQQQQAQQPQPQQQPPQGVQEDDDDQAGGGKGDDTDDADAGDGDQGDNNADSADDEDAGDDSQGGAGDGDQSESGDGDADQQGSEAGDDEGSEGDGSAAGGNAGGGSDDASEGDGSGDGDGGDAAYTLPHPSKWGEVLDAPATSQAELEAHEDEWRSRITQAINVARRANQGETPEALERIAEQVKEPRADWRAALRRFIDPSSRKDYAWTRPNRRLVSRGVYLPGAINDGVRHLGVAIDTSGSIDTDKLALFQAELQSVLDNGAVDSVTVVYCDDAVRRTAEFNSGDVIELSAAGYGGTAFAPAIAWFVENAPDIAGLLYFTDMECCRDDYGSEPHFGLLWAAYGDPRWFDLAPFGEVVEIGLE